MQNIIAIIKIIPALKAWVDSLIALYVQIEIANLKKADREAIRKAVMEHDQRDLEKQIGNPNPGEPSHIDGTDIVDSLPNVVPPKKGRS